MNCMGKKGGSPSLPNEPKLPTPAEKHHKNTGSPPAPDTDRMRARLIEELKTPFIERVNSLPSYSFIRQVKVENFDERVMTLSDKEIFDLYTEYEKIGHMRSGEKKEAARSSLLHRIESSILSDGSFLRRILKRR